MLKVGTFVVLAALAVAPPVSPAQSHQEVLGGQLNRQPQNVQRGQSNPQDKPVIQNSAVTSLPTKSAENGTEYWPAFFGLRLKITDSLLALFTFFLIVVGAVQAYRLRQTFESYMAGERSYIFPGAPDSTAFLPHGAYALYPTAANVPLPRVGINFGNVGRTSCVIKAVRTEILIGENLPKTPTFSYSVELTGDIVCRPDQQTDTLPFGLDRNLTLPEVESLRAGDVPIYVFGYVRYADIFGSLQTKGYCFRVTFGTDAYTRAAGGAVYNYRKGEKASPEMAL